MLAVTHRSQMRRATLQSLFAATEATGEQVPPQTHAALATTEETWIGMAWIGGCARQTLHQALVRRVERPRDAAVAYS
jgi:hypothetical protein